MNTPNMVGAKRDYIESLQYQRNIAQSSIAAGGRGLSDMNAELDEADAVIGYDYKNNLSPLMQFRDAMG